MTLLLDVDQVFHTSSRTGLLVTVFLYEGEIRSGQKLIAKFPDGKQLDITVRAIDVVRYNDEGCRVVGMLIDLPKSKRTLEGMTLTASEVESD